jgi:SAM-dependent methyltransferase
MEKLNQFAFASRKIPEYMHYRLLHCGTCDLLYASPVLPPQKIASAYEEAAFDSGEEAHYAARSYAEFLPRIVRRLGDLEGALDIGTGDGAFLEELLREGFTKVEGIEPSKAPILAAKPDIRPLIRLGLFDPKDYPAESLSLISCFQTLEHLTEPMETCQAAYQILKKNGAFFAVCHNRASLPNRLLGKKSPIFDIEHLQLFTPRSAKALMEKAGFSHVEVRSFMNVYPLHYLVKLMPFPNKTKETLTRLLKRAGIGRLPFFLPAGNMAVIGFKKS